MSVLPLNVLTRSSDPLSPGFPNPLQLRIASASRAALSPPAEVSSVARPLFSPKRPTPPTADDPRQTPHSAPQVTPAPRGPLFASAELPLVIKDRTFSQESSPRPITSLAAQPLLGGSSGPIFSFLFGKAHPAEERSPKREVHEVLKNPKPLKRRRVPPTCPAILKAHEILEAGFFTIACADKREHQIYFAEMSRGQFNAFCTFFPKQSQILEERPNEFLGVKIFHPDMRSFDREMVERIVHLHGSLREVGVLCPQIYNLQQFREGCGYLLVEFIPLPSGEVALEDLLVMLEKAYPKRLALDLKPDNLRRTSTGALCLIDWGGEQENEPCEIDAHFRKLIRNLHLEDLARASAILSPLFEEFRA